MSSLPTFMGRPNAWWGALLSHAACTRSFLAAQQQAGALGSAQRFAAAVRDQVGAPFQVHIGNAETLGGGVDEHRHLVLPGDVGHLLQSERPGILRAAEHHDHGGAGVDGGVQPVFAFHLDNLRSQHADGVVVNVARIARGDDLVPETGEIGETVDLFGVAAGNGRRSGVRQGGGAATGHDPGLGPGELRQSLADPFHQLVDMHEVFRGFQHGGLDFRWRERSAENGEGALAVDEGPHADRLIEIGAEAQGRDRRRPRWDTAP